MIITINFDGACNNRQQRPAMGIGIAVFINNEYQENISNFIRYISTNEERGTSNIAEWRGCMEAMRKVNQLKLIYPDAKFEVFSDSQIIVHQFNGLYNIYKEEFYKYFNQAKKLAARAGIKEINWVSRDYNIHADKLSKKGLQLTEDLDAKAT